MWLSRLVIVACAALAAGCADPLDQLADAGRGRVLRAASGEVLRLEDGRTVRLAGVHAPGPEAEAALQELTVGRDVGLLHGGGRTDAYGRTVAHVRMMRGRRWVQGALLDAGLAQVRTTSEDAALAGEMLRHEARARVRGRGLWADPARRVRLPGEVGPDDAGFMIVEGQVRRTERTRERLLLDFTQGRRGFSATIPSRRLRDFEAAGRSAEELEGRRVRVRGAVRSSGFGPSMSLDHPEQVELVRED